MRNLPVVRRLLTKSMKHADTVVVKIDQVINSLYCLQSRRWRQFPRDWCMTFGKVPTMLLWGVHQGHDSSSDTLNVAPVYGYFFRLLSYTLLEPRGLVHLRYGAIVCGAVSDNRRSNYSTAYTELGCPTSTCYRQPRTNKLTGFYDAHCRYNGIFREQINYTRAVNR